MSNPYAILDENYKPAPAKSAASSTSEATSHVVERKTAKREYPRKNTNNVNRRQRPSQQTNSNSNIAEDQETRETRGYRGDSRRGGRRGGRHVVPGDKRRQFDRQSGTGRGREVAKDGAGAHNWGKAGEENDTVRREHRPRRPRREHTPEEPKAEEGETAENGEEKKEEEPTIVEEQEQEEEVTFTLDEYLKQEKSKRAALALPKATARKAGEGVKVDSKLDQFQNVVKKDDNEIIIVKKEQPKSIEKQQQQQNTQTLKKKAVKLDAGDFFAGSPYVPRDERRDDRGVRGGRGGRGGRGDRRGPRVPRSGAAPILNESSFPSL